MAKPLAAFARVLPLTVQAASAPETHVMTRARQEAPAVAALAFELVADRTLERLRDGGATTSDVLDDLRPQLPAGNEPS